MLFDDYLAAQAQWEIKNSELLHALENLNLSTNIVYPSESLSPLFNTLEQRLSELHSDSFFSDLQGLTEIANGIAEIFSIFERDTYAENMAVISNALINLTTLLPESNDINDNIACSIEDARPYMSQSQQEACEQIITPKLSHRLTLKEALEILSLLLAIFVSLTSLLPNKQLDLIAEQQAQALELERQNNEYLEDMLEAQREENAALLRAFDSLTQTIGQLNDEIEGLKTQSPEDELPPSPSISTESSPPATK